MALHVASNAAGKSWAMTPLHLCHHFTGSQSETRECGTLRVALPPGVCILCVLDSLASAHVFALVLAHAYDVALPLACAPTFGVVGPVVVAGGLVPSYASTPIDLHRHVLPSVMLGHRLEGHRDDVARAAASRTYRAAVTKSGDGLRHPPGDRRPHGSRFGYHCRFPLW